MYVLTPWMKGLLVIIRKNIKKQQPTRVLLEGPPGASKTSFGYYVAEALKCTIKEFNCTSSMRAEELLWDIAVAPGNQIVYRKSALWEAFEASQNGPVVLVIDEIDKARERAEELLLRTLEKFSFRDPWGGDIIGNSGNIIVIATSNKKRNLMEPTLRRFPIRVKVDFPPFAIQKEIVRACLPAGFSCSTETISLVLRMAEHLRNEDQNKAPSYVELAELIWNAYSLFEAGCSNKEIAALLQGSLWKNGDFPGIPFNWVKALRTEYQKKLKN